MELPDHLKPKSREELEQWFLDGLEADPPPADDMLAVLAWLDASQEEATAREWAELLQEAAVGPARADIAMRLLDLRLAWHGENPAFRAVCRAACGNVFTDRLGAALVASAGFDRAEIPLRECLRRLRVLTALKPGVLCNDKTWGFGVVARLDDFYRKITIDFEPNAGHQMSFNYAGETLELLDEQHLMARRYRSPDAFENLVRNDAAQLVRIALASYGDMSAPRLKEVLVPAALPESDWKRFWDAARKGLKADSLVDLPARRNDPIRLLDAEKSYDEQWFAALSKERDIQSIIESIREWELESGTGSLDGMQRQVLSERIGFGIRGSQWQRPDRVASLLMVCGRLGFSVLPEQDVPDSGWRVDVGETIQQLFEPDYCVAALAALPAREVDRFLSFLHEHDAAGAGDLLLGVFPRLPVRALNAALTLLAGQAREQECAERLRGLLQERGTVPSVVYWACSHLEQTAAWSIVTMPDLLVMAVDVLGMACSGEDLKVKNLLHVLFENRDWLQAALGQLDAAARRDLLDRIQNARGLEATHQRGVMARIIRLHPELEETLESGEPKIGPERRKQLTSWHSYNARREQLRHLVEVLIPANSKEIAVARSYGDLSENHEYKAAKEHQGILLRRRGEFEQDLKDVQGSDFSGFPADRAGVGTCVRVERPDGRVNSYCILGEWDGDQELGIISSRTRLAELLEGHCVGDQVRLPVIDLSDAPGTGEETCKITAITPPDDAVKEWIGRGLAGVAGVDTGEDFC